MTVTGENPWHSLLHDRLRGNAHPMFVMPDTLWSAASLWAGSRAWTRALRDAGVLSGDRVVCALPAGPAFVQVLVACLWEGITFVPVPTAVALSDVIEQVRPVLCVTMTTAAHARCACWVPDAACQPPVAHDRVTRGAERVADAPSVVFRSHHPDGDVRWIPLSAESVLALLESHRPQLDLQGAVVLSVVPWHRPFGLILGLLASLLDANEVVVAPSSPEDVEVLCAMVREHPVTRVALLPEVLESWRYHPELRAVLGRVGGVVGADMITAESAALLAESPLRLIPLTNPLNC